MTLIKVFHIKEKKWLPIVLFNLFIVALAGLILRMFRFTRVPYLDYFNFMEGHSHFAFGGWGFMALFVAFSHAFLKKKDRTKNVYSRIFTVVLFAVWGMLISFPFSGYANISTAFSTLYIWITYWFAYRFYQDTKKAQPTFSLKMAKAALFFLVFSSIGPYTMGAIMASGYGGDPRAMNAIYFYLHFQYNGWFIFGLLALFFKWLENHQILFSKKKASLFHRLLFWSCFPAFLLSVLWSKPIPLLFIIAGIAGLVQLLALIPFFQIIYHCKKEICNGLKPAVKLIGMGVIFLLGLKYLLQFLSALPVIADWILTDRNVVIAYLHLVLVGVYTIFLLIYFIQENSLRFNALTQSGLWLFTTGFILTEALLFGQSGLRLFHQYIPNFGSWMFYTTIPLPLGGVMIWIGNLQRIQAKHAANRDEKSEKTWTSPTFQSNPLKIH